MILFDKLFGKKTPSNSRLDRAMAALAKGEDPKLRREMYEALLKSKLLLSVPNPPEESALEGKSQIKERLRIQFHSIENAQKKPAMLAFTSVESLLKWKKEGSPYIALDAKDVFALAMKAGMNSIVINPAGPTGGELTHPEIHILAEGAIPQATGARGATDLEVKPGTEVRVGAPSKPPSEKLLEALQQSLSKNPEVKAAYLFEIAIGEGTPHWAVGLEVQGDQAKAQELFQAVGPEAGKHLAPSESLDFALLDRGPMSQEIRRVVQPFYKR